MCFINYALRLGLISIAPSPWWILPVELVFQGPTYALTYTTVVAYANELAPPGASATMQGIAAGMDDGIGKSICVVVFAAFFDQSEASHLHTCRHNSVILISRLRYWKYTGWCPIQIHRREKCVSRVQRPWSFLQCHPFGTSQNVLKRSRVSCRFEWK